MPLWPYVQGKGLNVNDELKKHTVMVAHVNILNMDISNVQAKWKHKVPKCGPFREWGQLHAI